MFSKGRKINRRIGSREMCEKQPFWRKILRSKVGRFVQVTGIVLFDCVLIGVALLLIRISFKFLGFVVDKSRMIPMDLALASKVIFIAQNCAIAFVAVFAARHVIQHVLFVFKRKEAAELVPEHFPKVGYHMLIRYGIETFMAIGVFGMFILGATSMRWFTQNLGPPELTMVFRAIELFFLVLGGFCCTLFIFRITFASVMILVKDIWGHIFRRKLRRNKL